MKDKKTALIVDDEEIVAEIEEFMFQKIGFEILIAKNSAQACQLYQDEKDNIDLVVLDMILPDENGANTYKQLKKINPNIKVIVSSGMGKDSAVREILNDWPNGFLSKPFKFDEFSKSVDNILSRN